MNQITGAYRLISFETASAFANGYDFGANPVGLLIYDPSGYMSVQFMSKTRLDSDYSILDFDAKVKAFNSFYSYFGTYEIDWQSRVITHRVIGSLHPYEQERIYRRDFEVGGGILKLTTIPSSDGKSGSNVVKLIWQRIESVA